MHRRWSSGITLNVVLILTAVLLAFMTIAVEAAFPLTVTDHIGNQITFEKAPTRIVSLVPSHTETLFAIGAGNQVAAVDDYSDWPEDATRKPKVGNLTGINYEFLVSLQPDLVLGLVSHYTSGVAEKLTSLGIPVLILEPQDFSATYETIKLLGQITGHECEAEKIVSDMKEKVQDVLTRVSNAEPRRVFYEVWPDPLMTVGPGGFIHELITMANGQNIAADADTAWPIFSLEQLLARDPEVIITTFAETISDLDSGRRSQWSQISAVKNRRYYLIDPNLISRTGPRLADGLAELARLIHPEVF